MTKLTWLQLKQLINANNLPFIWTQDDNSYAVSAFNGPSEMMTIIMTSASPSSDQIDFETNYKAKETVPITIGTTVLSTPPNSAKTITVAGVTHSLYVRNTGFQSTVNTGANTISYTITYPWVQLLGAAVINCTALDTVSLYVYDNSLGTYSGVPNALLNQFGFTVNLPAGFYETQSNFEADLYQGMVIKLVYNSVSPLSNTVGFNFIMNQVV